MKNIDDLTPLQLKVATMVYPTPKIFETSLSASLEQAIAFRIIAQT
ncbi:MAG: hypothetical protein HC852_02030 [Acaryochloridaceae cyanobacterium RU_4_10]|nr:hypothetical protein [Acaryochloridaceae cyanobacterium RU_4_10]